MDFNRNTCIITKTCLYNFDPLKPHFYIVKLGFTGVCIIFLISAQNIDCGYSLEPPHRGGSNEYPQSMFCAEIWKISEFFIWKFSFFLVVKSSIYLNRHVFVLYWFTSYMYLEAVTFYAVTLRTMLFHLTPAFCTFLANFVFSISPISYCKMFFKICITMLT